MNDDDKMDMAAEKLPEQDDCPASLPPIVITGEIKGQEYEITIHLEEFPSEAARDEAYRVWAWTALSAFECE